MDRRRRRKWKVEHKSSLLDVQEYELSVYKGREAGWATLFVFFFHTRCEGVVVVC
jgi:hypothetical protein